MAADKAPATDPPAPRTQSDPPQWWPKPGNHMHMRASKIEGLKVVNPAGDELGKINDFVIDIHSGKITYAALDFGGFLGIGDKLFAVPWSAFTVSSGGKDHEHQLTLDVSKDKLKNAPGFDKNHWPDMANPDWSKPVDEFYEGHKTARRGSKLAVELSTSAVSRQSSTDRQAGGRSRF